MTTNSTPCSSGPLAGAPWQASHRRDGIDQYESLGDIGDIAAGGDYLQGRPVAVAD